MEYKKKVTKNVSTTETKSTTDTETTFKPGRTLLLKSTSGSFNSSDLSSFEGLVNKSDTKTSNSVFLTFDTIENSTKAYAALLADSNYNVKYSYYRIFFTMNGLTDTTDYNDIKKQLMNFVATNSKSLVLYCKFYRKENSYIGCGDLTIDTMEGMNTLLAKENGFKDYSFGEYTGSFYRYNNKKDNKTSSNQQKAYNH